MPRVLNVRRRDLQDVANIRLREAKALLDGGFYDGAFYLASYAVECALESLRTNSERSTRAVVTTARSSSMIAACSPRR